VHLNSFWGTPDHLRYVRDTLEAQHPEVHILVVKSNESNNTYDGVDIGGERVTHEIENEVASLEKQGAKLKKISITGYSLGGLVSRYAVGLLYKNGFFDKYEPVNFTTFASPHVGIRAPMASWRTSIWNYLGGRTLGNSGQQIFITDNFRGTGRPLLTIMADPTSIFVKGLKMFKNKSIYANTMNDRSVPYWSAYFSRVNPYVDFNRVQVYYLPNQPEGELEVILDPARPSVPKKSVRDELTTYQKWTYIDTRTIKSVQMYMVVGVMLPLVIPLFLLNAGWQTVQSGQRLKQHESGKVFDLSRYRQKLLDEANAVRDHISERSMNSKNPGYLPTPPPESVPASEIPEGAKPAIELSKRERAREHGGPWPILALTKDQFDIIDGLNSLDIAKYECHIRRVRHTHAAIIVRTPRGSFTEGKVVVAHWARGFEV
jgi:hypothetical protein